jgi:hypothetical protein
VWVVSVSYIAVVVLKKRLFNVNDTFCFLFSLLFEMWQTAKCKLQTANCKLQPRASASRNQLGWLLKSPFSP